MRARDVDRQSGPHRPSWNIATNTIAQGDTRESGLRPLIQEGFEIIEATRSMQWPGEAAVVVAVVHLTIGLPKGIGLVLDGRPVPAINSRLRMGRERQDPVPLKSNADEYYLGSKIYGQGFLLTLEERSLLIKEDSRNSEIIRPYLGGEEVNSHPQQLFERYVINFEERSLDEAGRWPALLKIVRDHVKPERDKVRDNGHGLQLKKYWWRFFLPQTNLYLALAKLERCLVTSQVSKHLCFSFQPVDRIFSHKLCVFLLPEYRHFAVLQSRLHIMWAWLLSSTMKSDLNYSASDCFETFPFPKPNALTALDLISQILYDARAAYMSATNQGLTATYNQLKDPGYVPDPPEDLAAIRHLRQLHEELDRAVLAAYGWSDIAVPPFCPATDSERAAVSLFEDTVIDRLFALNAERAAEERGVALQAGATKPAAGPKPKSPGRKPRAAKNQTSMLDDD